MSELLLYDFGNSVCCQKVRITLRAKGLEWRAIPVNLFTAEQYDPKYLKLNPKGVVPTIRGCKAKCGCGANSSTKVCSTASPN
jgi:glutathione S-transferase